MRAFKTFITTLTLGAGFASALTASCQDSLQGLLTNPDAECLNIAALLQITITQDVPSTVQNWLTGFCGNGECSQEALGNVVANMTGGCAEDLAAVGVTASESDIQSTVTQIVQQAYPIARQVVCLKDKTSGNFCPVELLTNLESIIGKLGIDDLSFVNLAQDVNTLLTSDETKSKLACTQCVSSTFAVLDQELSGVLGNSSVTDPLTNACGADFLTGGIGENIEQTASTAQFTANTNNNDNTNSAMVLFTPAAWTLAGVFAVFTLIL